MVNLNTFRTAVGLSLVGDDPSAVSDVKCARKIVLSDNGAQGNLEMRQKLVDALSGQKGVAADYVLALRIQLGLEGSDEDKKVGNMPLNEREVRDILEGADVIANTQFLTGGRVIASVIETAMTETGKSVDMVVKDALDQLERDLSGFEQKMAGDLRQQARDILNAWKSAVNTLKTDYDDIMNCEDEGVRNSVHEKLEFAEEVLEMRNSFHEIVEQAEKDPNFDILKVKLPKVPDLARWTAFAPALKRLQVAAKPLPAADFAQQARVGSLKARGRALDSRVGRLNEEEMRQQGDMLKVMLAQILNLRRKCAVGESGGSSALLQVVEQSIARAHEMVERYRRDGEIEGFDDRRRELRGPESGAMIR